jgi:hypothetical protein
MTTIDLSAWFGTPLGAALLAAVGYVTKLAVDGISSWNKARRERRAKLVIVQSLLLASKAVFDIQKKLVCELCVEIGKAHSEINGSYDRILAAGYPLLNERQKLRHGLIRNYTIHGLHPLNMEMLSWLAADTFFKGAGKRGAWNALSVALQQLEAHLMLWRAKYEFWIPNKPEHAIVYMADEEQEGIGFPIGIETLIRVVTGGKLRIPQ